MSDNWSLFQARMKEIRTLKRPTVLKQQLIAEYSRAAVSDPGDARAILAQSVTALALELTEGQKPARRAFDGPAPNDVSAWDARRGPATRGSKRVTARLRAEAEHDASKVRELVVPKWQPLSEADYEDAVEALSGVPWFRWSALQSVNPPDAAAPFPQPLKRFIWNYWRLSGGQWWPETLLRLVLMGPQFLPDLPPLVARPLPADVHPVEGGRKRLYSHEDLWLYELCVIDPHATREDLRDLWTAIGSGRKPGRPVDTTGEAVLREIIQAQGAGRVDWERVAPLYRKRVKGRGRKPVKADSLRKRWARIKGGA